MTESGWHGLQIVGVKYNCKGYDDVLGAMNIISIYKKYQQILSSKSTAERYDFLEMFVHQAHSSEHVYEFTSEEQPGGGRKFRPQPGLPCFIQGIFMKRLKVFNTAKIKRNLRGLLGLFNAKVKNNFQNLSLNYRGCHFSFALDLSDMRSLQF